MFQATNRVNTLVHGNILFLETQVDYSTIVTDFCRTFGSHFQNLAVVGLECADQI